MSLAQRLKGLVPAGNNVRTLPFGIGRGLRLRLDLRDGWLRTYLGLYEVELNRHLRRLCSAGASSFDIGGQIGYDALVLGKLSGAEVLSVEPLQDYCKTIRENVAENPRSVGRITVLDGYVDETSGGSDGSKRVTIDELAEKFFVPDFIKIDIEGGEVSALRGAKRTLTERKPHLLVEVHSLHLENDCLTLLRALGYSPLVVDQRRFFREHRPIEHNRWIVAVGQTPAHHRFRASKPVRPLLLGCEWFTSIPGGLNRYLADLQSALVKVAAEPQVVVVGPTPSQTWLHGTSSPERSLLTRMLAVRRAAADLADSVDVVDAHFALYALLPITTTILRRIPLVVHFQGPWADESRYATAHRRRMASAVKVAIESIVYRRAHAVIVLSEAFARLVVERYGLDPSRVEVVAPGVDLDRFRPGDRVAARRYFTLPSGVFVAVSVRRLEARMGLGVLLAAWARLQLDDVDAILLVAGDGAERSSLERQRALLPFPDRVRFLGAITDKELVTLYQAADCSVVPSRALEGFGLVTLESAACGTPPIVTDVGGLADGAIGLDRSLIVAPNDESGLATRLKEAATGALPSRTAARLHAEKYPWDAVARRHLQIYERAVSRRRLRVTYLGHTAQLSGGELALERLLAVLEDVEPTVILAEEGPLAARFREAAVPVEIMPMGEDARHFRREDVQPSKIQLVVLRDAIVMIWRLSRRLRAQRPDLVHTNTLKAALYGGAAGRLAGVPVIWHVRDRIAPDYLPPAAVRFIRLAYRILPTAVIANSNATLSTLKGDGDCVRVLDAVVGSPVARAAPRTIDRALRPTGPLTIGMVGRLAPWKGQDLFLRAFAQCFPGEEARARIVGASMFDGDDWRRRLQQLAVELGIAERVDFVGFKHDVGAEYECLDIFVHASVIPEPFGQVILEAMANGLGVIVPDAGGPREIVTDGVDGLLYRMGNVDSLARQMRRLADDAKLRASLGRAARARVNDFGPEKVRDQIMQVYSAVLSGKRHLQHLEWQPDRRQPEH